MKSKSIIKWCALLCACWRSRRVRASGRRRWSIARDAAPLATAPLPAAPAVVRTAKDGIYVAQRGDTLQNVALAFGVRPKGSRALERLLPNQMC